MLQLSNEGLMNKEAWKEKDIELPLYDRDKITQNTQKNPTWIHFGAGNIFRGFIANAYQKVLNNNKADTGIIAVESFDYEVVDKVYTPYDNLSLLVLMKADGSFEKTVVGSIVESLTTDQVRKADQERLREIIKAKSLQMVSFTITEKGYALKNPQGRFLDIVLQDFEKGPQEVYHTMSIIAALMYTRYKEGAYPITLVSMDNCSHNGDILKEAVITMGKEWHKRGFVEEGFVTYLEDQNKVAYPFTMIDKITPRPSKVVQEKLEEFGIENLEPIVTSKNSYMAPFVNAEISEYLVIEDIFTNGRPELEGAGVIFTDRETVNRIETMKVTTCLNPLHTGLAVSGCLLGYTLIADEMNNPVLKRFVEKIGYDEGLKVVVDPGIINPKEFLDEVVYERFMNPYIPDSPQRIATDTSQKVGIRFGETIKSYMKNETLNAKDLVAIPLALALWCRYLLGVDDQGMPFEISSDPLLEMLKNELKEVALGSKDIVITGILSNKNIFGVDLYEAGLADKIQKMFNELIEGPGAVLKTMEKYCM
ncbi:mannitol dehydrogenase family protein [Petrocella sp. FN5]|uniref:mannitol dehydrogenase family protein n=1 Tax=Petrocella sp. FN5 TaxID=3032002 RepID=UPI0023DC976B|nr:mannitol dehydrogenase family protein [Petrocella sp. FN5]MDF1617055.1 mannitol dehydrogenase family protein [Petrocella sp. FN5]